MAATALRRRLIHGQWQHLLYALRTRLRGLDLSRASLEAIGLDADRAHHHHNSGGPDLAKLIRNTVAPPAGSRVIDFGSGKGGACFTLEQTGRFIEVLGVELSRTLVATAQANATKLRSSVRFVEQDASMFTDLDRFTHFYFYNPFPAPIVRRVVANITASLECCPRRAVLIYQYPDTCEVPNRIDAKVFPLAQVITPRLAHPFHVCIHECV